VRISLEKSYITSYLFCVCISVEERDIIELEKKYWSLKAQSKTGKFDQETFKSFVLPTIPDTLCAGMYSFGVSTPLPCRSIITLLKKQGIQYNTGGSLLQSLTTCVVVCTPMARISISPFKPLACKQGVAVLTKYCL